MSDSSKLWSKEYTQKGIPSSFRQKPSGAMKLLDIPNIKGKIAADLGCGMGRNTFYLIKNGASKVYALDFVPEAIREIKSAKNPKITAICHDLTKPWPIPDNALNLIIDIFCFKHQASLKNQEFYKSEISRTLKPKGFLLLDLAATDDGFYGKQPKKELKPSVYKITDPVTEVNSLLYTKGSLLAEYPGFELLKFTNDRKEGQMHNQTYLRSTLKFLLQKV